MTGARRRPLLGLVLCLAVLVAARLLPPHPSGLGTHTSLGLPPCGLVFFFGLPCPTCGMTTAFALAARGRLTEAAQAQPLGLLLGLATLIATALCARAAWRGAWPRALRPLDWGPRTWGILGLLALASWAYKIASYRAWL